MALLTKEEQGYEEMVKLVRKPVQRFGNTQVGSEPLRKFSTLFLLFNGLQDRRLDLFCSEVTRFDRATIKTS